MTINIFVWLQFHIQDSTSDLFENNVWSDNDLFVE